MRVPEVARSPTDSTVARPSRPACPPPATLKAAAVCAWVAHWNGEWPPRVQTGGYCQCYRLGSTSRAAPSPEPPLQAQQLCRAAPVVEEEVVRTVVAQHVGLARDQRASGGVLWQCQVRRGAPRHHITASRSTTTVANSIVGGLPSEMTESGPVSGVCGSPRDSRGG